VKSSFDVSHYLTNEFIPAPDAPAPAPLNPRRPLRLGLNWIANDQIAPWLLGREQGFFAEVGIDLQIVEGGPGRDHLNTLFAGHVDVYTGFAEPLFQMVTSPTGSAVMMICANMKTSPLCWLALDKTVAPGQRSSKKIGPADLRGRTFGVQPGGPYYLGYVLGQMGMSIDDVKVVNAGAGPDALIGGAMDFYQGWLDNQPRLLERNGYHNWFALNFADVGYPDYGDISTVTPAFYAAEKELLRRYVYALDRSMRYLIAHPQESAEIVAHTPEVSSYQLSVADVLWRIKTDTPLFQGNGAQPLLALDAGQLHDIAVQMYRYHSLELPGSPKP
jgi:NitT/TauT family transport system substrate-binding protein